ncbi:MAG: DUF3710 domain-containing protein [Micromonosporaceae bacterium]|nr:DUF3710 domain-containing protein [Micromonosporaceae bacterium]
MKFFRGRGGGRRGRDEAAEQPHEAEELEEFGDDQEDEPEAGRVGAHAKGPYDITEAPRGVQRLDLGSLQIPAVDGVEIRVQADPDGTIQQVVLVHGESALQLGVFAAPRSEGIWDEVRDEIRQSLIADGAKPSELPGEYGQELLARVRTPDGGTDLRFVGIDGPRWMVRGVFQGRAAVDPSAAGPLLECLHGLVVDRGPEAKPVREPLRLRLPREMAEQAQRMGPNGVAPGGGPVPPARPGGGPARPAPRRRSP